MNERTPGHVANKSLNEFLKQERQSVSQHEFFDGKVIRRSGGNRWHNLIVSNISIGIGSRSHGHKTEMYIANMRVMLESNAICYPDIAIVSGEPTFADARSDLLLNPTLLIDIFSSDMHSAVKTAKFESYLALPSIRECLLVKEDEMRVEHYAKQNAKQWLYKIYNERDDVITLDAIGCKLSLQEVYSQIRFGKMALSSSAVN